MTDLFKTFSASRVDLKYYLKVWSYVQFKKYMVSTVSSSEPTKFLTTIYTIYYIYWYYIFLTTIYYIYYIVS